MDQNILREFLKNIINQSIVLKYIKFEANTNIEGKVEESSLQRMLKLEKIEVHLADIKAENASEELREELKALIVQYEGKYKDVFKPNKDAPEDEEIPLVSAEFIYEIKLHLKSDNIFFELNDSEKEELLEVFIGTTGKLMLFPYVRHLLHMLSLEAGINLPPLKPILIK